jgi:hypothetical protein
MFKAVSKKQPPTTIVKKQRIAFLKPATNGTSQRKEAW